MLVNVRCPDVCVLSAKKTQVDQVYTCEVVSGSAAAETVCVWPAIFNMVFVCGVVVVRIPELNTHELPGVCNASAQTTVHG